jgi:hypothetical protein
VSPANCPRCGAPAVAGQEYCLECGLRLPVRRLGSAPGEERSLRRPLLGLFVVAVAGALAAVGLTWEGDSGEAVITATGGSLTVTAPPEAIAKFAGWPRDREGWTVVLASVPKAKGGRDAALARAQQARAHGLPRVGVLDSGTIASLHPGYWVVFTGVYDSEAEATSHLLRARAVVRTAGTREIAG